MEGGGWGILVSMQTRLSCLSIQSVATFYDVGELVSSYTTKHKIILLYKITPTRQLWLEDITYCQKVRGLNILNVQRTWVWCPCSPHIQLVSHCVPRWVELFLWHTVYLLLVLFSLCSFWPAQHCFHTGYFHQMFINHDDHQSSPASY